ncbi:MAG: hypothetical protein COB56_00985 [Robiginitomaculum sp.]|nr:MAG: hypothetical protein COB56_00985 [Robiginitomaculum sp.]
MWEQKLSGYGLKPHMGRRGYLCNERLFHIKPMFPLYAQYYLVSLGVWGVGFGLLVDYNNKANFTTNA